MAKVFKVSVLALEEADPWTVNYSTIPHSERLKCELSAVGKSLCGKPGLFLMKILKGDSK